MSNSFSGFVVSAVWRGGLSSLYELDEVRVSSHDEYIVMDVDVAIEQ